MKTSFQKRIDELKQDEQELYRVADSVGTSVGYLTGHLYRRSREPRITTGFRLSTALSLSIQDIVDHFNEQNAA